MPPQRAPESPNTFSRRSRTPGTRLIPAKHPHVATATERCWLTTLAASRSVRPTLSRVWQVRHKFPGAQVAPSVEAKHPEAERLARAVSAGR